MSRSYEKLTADDLKHLSVPGRYSDGGGLYFVIGKKGERRWAFLYKSRRNRLKSGLPKPVELGLGGAPYGNKPGVSLVLARRKAADARNLLALGKDPLEEKTNAKGSPVLARMSVLDVAHTAAGQLNDREKNISFGEYGDAYVAAVTKDFKNPVHIRQWHRSIDVQAGPLRTMRVRDIGTDDILAVLRPIWAATPESAKRLQSRIEKVLSAATVERYRSGPNPAQWVGNLKDTELKTRKVSDKKNHKALPFGDAPSFMAELRKLTSMSARALSWTIHTAARTGETLGATWGEIDFASKVWTIPASRMKAGKEHRVPLCDRALAILQDLPRINNRAPDDFIFTNGVRPLSNMAMTECLKGIRKGVTVHGYRSTFSDWANETTQHDPKVVEFALAHVLGNKAEAAYRRGDVLDKRRALLNDWDAYLEGRVTKNTPL